MRFLKAIILALVTVVSIMVLNASFGTIPPLGRFLDPVNGWSANSATGYGNGSKNIKLSGVKQPVTVFFESRLVPHIEAQNEHDLFFIQGYLHAFFRLWQMDFQTRAAAGRISEVVGEKFVRNRNNQPENVILRFDRMQRRKGMVYAAERSLSAMENDPNTRMMLDAYTEGVNAFIEQLTYRQYPIEYKLLNYKPETWTNLKTALLLKYMADDLTGYTEDIPLTLLRDQLSDEEFADLFPERLKNEVPVIPAGTRFSPASLAPAPPPSADIAWFHFPGEDVVNTPAIPEGSMPGENYHTDIGSNNWAISGSHTLSGAPILCNDPHLGLNLPALWFEMQLQAPGINVYGVSLPGAPGIVIGFNNTIAWGLTNNYRDVKDFYAIDRIDQNFYRFDGTPRPFEKRIEVIKIKNRPDFTDTVDFTIHGPVMYDEHFPGPQKTTTPLAMTWMAHRPTNELLAVYMLNKADDYIAFTEAIMHFDCPAQNFVYADRDGNIAMWGQGQFINKWKEQGRFVMNGNTSATLWGADIPKSENPHVLNPPQGYVASANQVTTDSSYPYWYNGYFSDFRAWRINDLLEESPPATAEANEQMQQDVYSLLAEKTFRVLKGFQKSEDTGWNMHLSSESVQATRFQLGWDYFYKQLWNEKFAPFQLNPSAEKTVEILQRDSIHNPYHSLIQMAISATHKHLDDTLSQLSATGEKWYQVKNTSLIHLAKIPALSYEHLQIGGWGNTINAAKSNHGPSWRMVVELGKDSIRAFGVYPGGQSGNPGSAFYGNFVAAWTEGKYYPLVFLKDNQALSPQSTFYRWSVIPDK